MKAFTAPRVGWTIQMWLSHRPQPSARSPHDDAYEFISTIAHFLTALLHFKLFSFTVTEVAHLTKPNKKHTQMKPPGDRPRNRERWSLGSLPSAFPEHFQWLFLNSSGPKFGFGDYKSSMSSKVLFYLFRRALLGDGCHFDSILHFFLPVFRILKIIFSTAITQQTS